MLHAFIINMPDRADRRLHMLALLERTGFTSYEFVTPVSVDVVPSQYAHLTKGYLSLNLTVRNRVFGRAVDMGLEQFVVFEDDLMERVPADSVQQRLADIMQEVPVDWDMIYLEYCMERCGAARTVSPSLRSAVKPYCTAAIVYRTAALDRLRGCLDTRKQLIDFSYVDCITSGELVAYVASPPLFAQDAFFTGDLAHTTSPRNIQYWLNWIIHMYPEPGTAATHYPRLPACMTPTELLHYVRWRSVIVLLIVATAIMVVVLTRTAKGARRRPLTTWW